MSKVRKSFPLRLDPALYEALERWAAQELRSVNGQIEFLLRQAVNNSKRGVLPRSLASADEIPPAEGRRTGGS
jgi:hypothetical protein